MIVNLLCLQPQPGFGKHQPKGRYDWMKYMLGQYYFKEKEHHQHQAVHDEDNENDIEEIPYSVLEQYEVRS